MRLAAPSQDIAARVLQAISRKASAAPGSVKYATIRAARASGSFGAPPARIVLDKLGQAAGIGDDQRQPGGDQARSGGALRVEMRIGQHGEVAAAKTAQIGFGEVFQPCANAIAQTQVANQAVEGAQSSQGLPAITR